MINIFYSLLAFSVLALAIHHFTREHRLQILKT